MSVTSASDSSADAGNGCEGRGFVLCPSTFSIVARVAYSRPHILTLSISIDIGAFLPAPTPRSIVPRRYGS